MSLMSELKRRKVFKVGAAYLVVAWLVVQAASIAFPTFEAPPWALRVFIFVVLLGLPVALVLAWTLEVTPEGVKVDRAPIGNTRMFAIAGVLVLLAVGWYFKGMPALREEPAATAATPGWATGGNAQRRLAVLPLANFSPDPNNAFFADGLHDDMLTALSRMQGVAVISRTTMQSFKDSRKKLAEIAGEIGATHVLEGAVRRDALRVRLTVQLIDAGTDDHLWAETYDRPLEESLTLQTAVAKQVAAAMQVALPEERDAAPPTANPTAYDLYLRAQLAGAPWQHDDALAYLDVALLLDPGFALARAKRARQAAVTIWFDETRRAQLLPRLESDLAQLRREAPDLVELGVADAIHTYYIERDYPGALAGIEKVLTRDPTNREALDTHGFLLRRLGRNPDALPIIQRVAALDPSNSGAVLNLAETLAFLRRYREAIEVLDAGLERMPNQWQLAARRADSRYALTGDVDQLGKDNEALRGRMPEEAWQGRRWSRAEPSPERLAYFASLGDGWSKSPGGGLFPRALDLAWEADFLGETAQRDRYAAQAEAMYATLEPAVRARGLILASSAQLLALQGRREAAIAEAEAALETSLRSKDVLFHAFVRLGVAIALARVGEAERSLNHLEALVADSVLRQDNIRDHPHLRKALGDQPRYQALLQKIEAGFEKP